MTIYLFKDSFHPIALNDTFIDHPSILDLNGDGISDVIEFIYDESATLLFCRKGTKLDNFENCADLFDSFEYAKMPYPNFSPIFADIDDDLVPEIIFGFWDQPKHDKLELSVWKMKNDE